ncbi:hypothetical protein F4553_002174 [Allocatelliglobosispora scoriae]|uniref:Ankyrin repeat domain-containing protein n=1 Tax=Allocatelliglobosispora scoriae TaxID=643052 RepID=A0A841BMA3_9ACTN|nr:ankyrin repeat domain-containing protein [Allocatelliglobosispora scoriae]MBB5868795.1 hypothetical protein [Allocatelliglobosispora scoriae]
MSGDLMELSTWRRIRRYAVPSTVIDACTRAREAGDWRAACAAGQIEVAFDIAAVRDTFGPQTGGRIEAELLHFAPDLLRWHLPRALGGRTSLATGATIRLLTVGSAALTVTLPVSVDGSQRLRLDVISAGTVSDGPEFDLPAYLWDVRRGDELRAAWGGTAARMPRFGPDATPLPEAEWGHGDDAPDLAERILALSGAGDLVAAWAEAGITLDAEIADIQRWNQPQLELLGVPLDPRAVAAEARRLAETYDAKTVVIEFDYRTRVVIDLKRKRMKARLVSWEEWRKIGSDGTLRRISPSVHRRSPDLDLLWHGLISTGDLHPLVRAALFPHATAAPLLVDAPAEPTRVRCRGEWHRIGHEHGRLQVLDHTAEEAQRERVMRSLGGAVTGCFAVEQAWTGQTGRLPKALRAQRRDLWQRMLHGGTQTVVDLLDAGMNPHIRDGRGMTLLHMLLAFDHEVLLPRLLDAGLDINTPDKEQRTPLHMAVVFGWSGGPIRAILDAGGDPHRGDQEQMSVIDFIDDALEYRDRNEDFTEAITYLKERA